MGRPFLPLTFLLASYPRGPLFGRLTDGLSMTRAEGRGSWPLPIRTNAHNILRNFSFVNCFLQFHRMAAQRLPWCNIVGQPSPGTTDAALVENPVEKVSAVTLMAPACPSPTATIACSTPQQTQSWLGWAPDASPGGNEVMCRGLQQTAKGWKLTFLSKRLVNLWKIIAP